MSHGQFTECCHANLNNGKMTKFPIFLVFQNIENNKIESELYDKYPKIYIQNVSSVWLEMWVPTFSTNYSGESDIPDPIIMVITIY